MIVLHADSDSFENDVVTEIFGNSEAVYKHLFNSRDVYEFLKKNQVVLLVVGERLDDITGLELINIINSSLYQKLQMIYIVNNPEDYYLDNYVAIGVRDCILRSEVSAKKVNSFLTLLKAQNRLSIGMSSLKTAVVDDSKVSLKVVEKMLMSEDIKDVTIYNDPVSLLKDFKSYDLFFIDMVMPQISGDKLVAMIRKMSPNSIIIAMSTVDNVKTISNVLSVGADDYIIKPFTNVELTARIKTNYRSFTLLKELEEKNRELDILSKTDSLTGAFNHGHIFKTIINEINSSLKNRTPLSLVLIDLDFFKKVNDSFGHGVGDEVLRCVAELFKKRSRRRDSFGRYGGEEFIFVMPNTEISEGYKIVNEIRSEFSSLDIEGLDYKATFSGGLVQWDGVEEEVFLIKRADENLYKAKESGRNIIIE